MANRTCICGGVMSNVASPNSIVNRLIDRFQLEKFQNLAWKELDDTGTIIKWWDHFRDSGSREVWKCPVCDRLYVEPLGKPEDVVVYKIEQVGVDWQ